MHGGNRAGWIDPFNHFVGRVFWRIGLHSEVAREGALEWDILHVSWDGGVRPRGRVAHGTAEGASVEACDPREVAQIAWEAEYPGGYLLRGGFVGVENGGPLWVVPPVSQEEKAGWAIDDPMGLLDGLLSDGQVPVSTRPGSEGLVFLTGEGTRPMPFWRESAYEFSDGAFWDALGYREKWERLLPMSPDRALDLPGLAQAYPDRDWYVLLNRIDVRTYAEHPVLMRSEGEDGTTFITTLRPFGGLGNCPRGLLKNPSGAEFVRQLRSLL